MSTAIVLASGPSLSREQIIAADSSGHFTIAVNATYAKAPMADVLYGGDFLFYRTYIADIRRCFRGALWTIDRSAAARWQLNHIRGVNGEGLGSPFVNMNGNSGMQALNLAFLWGYTKIILLGFDMKLGPNGERHHHPDHPKPCVQEQLFGEWIHKAEKIARDVKKYPGLDVVNCTPDSAMHCFRQSDLNKEL